MSSSDERRRLGDIVENAARIAEYLRDVDAARFAEGGMVVDASERCMERIAEAVVKIGAARMALIAPSVPVERVRGLGNMLRHAYDLVDLKVIFDLMTLEMPALAAAAQSALEDR